MLNECNLLEYLENLNCKNEYCVCYKCPFYNTGVLGECGKLYKYDKLIKHLRSGDLIAEISKKMG